MTKEFNTGIECDLYDYDRKDLRCINLHLKWEIKINIKKDHLNFDINFKSVSGLFRWVEPRLDPEDWTEDPIDNFEEVSLEGWTIDNKMNYQDEEIIPFWANLDFNTKTIIIE